VEDIYTKSLNQKYPSKNLSGGIIAALKGRTLIALIGHTGMEYAAEMEARLLRYF
jgi:hypothetical protein